MSRGSRSSDEALMARVKKDDTAAFELLYERYHQRLYHFILGLVKERTLAEDLFQETFLRIFRERKSYRKKSRFSTYLFTIARNLCLDTLNSWQRRHISGSDQGRIRSVPFPSKGPAELLEEAETTEAIKRAIEGLPEDQREALLLSKYAGLSYKEIAEVLKSSPDAVKQRVYRALVFLRKRLRKEKE